MLLVEQFLADAPAFVAIAAREREVLAHGHYDSMGSAVEWCGRAMRKVVGATQISIAKPTIVAWESFGRVPALMPVQGWILKEHGWEQSEPGALFRMFDRTPSSPSDLLTNPPPSVPQHASTPSVRISSVEAPYPPVPKDEHNVSDALHSLTKALHELTVALRAR